MIFGTKSQFAIEVELEPGPDRPVSGKNVIGRLRAWIGGHSVGRFDEPCCWLGPTANHLATKCTQFDRLWHASFEELSMHEVFDRIDYLYYRAHRGEILGEHWSDAEREQHQREADAVDLDPMLFLDSSEAFDGWKAFLVRPTPTELVALFAPPPQREVLSHRIPVADFEATSEAFGQWLLAQERQLLPELKK